MAAIFPKHVYGMFLRGEQLSDEEIEYGANYFTNLGYQLQALGSGFADCAEKLLWAGSELKSRIVYNHVYGERARQQYREDAPKTPIQDLLDLGAEFARYRLTFKYNFAREYYEITDERGGIVGRCKAPADLAEFLRGPGNFYL